jgi:thymidylate synthase ThyX
MSSNATIRVASTTEMSLRFTTFLGPELTERLVSQFDPLFDRTELTIASSNQSPADVVAAVKRVIDNVIETAPESADLLNRHREAITASTVKRKTDQAAVKTIFRGQNRPAGRRPRRQPDTGLAM